MLIRLIIYLVKIFTSEICFWTPGLDPAQPGFEGAHPDTRLNPSDAMFVDVIHTNADHFITCLGLGMMSPVGEC